MIRGLPSPLLRTIAILVLSLAPVACDETPPPKDPTTKLDPAEQAKIHKSRQKIDAAKDALDSKGYDQARKLLKEASDLNVESHKFEIEETLEKLDKRQAKMWFNEAHELFTQKKCKEAFSQLAEQIDGLQSEAFTRELRKLAGAEAQECANAAIDSMTTAGKFAEARAFANADSTKAVLGAPGAKKLATELDLVIAEAIKGQIQDDIKAKKWGQAIDKVDAALKAGNATEDIAAQAIAAVRDAAAPDLGAQASKAIGSGDAAKVLAQVDATFKLLRWEPNAADGTPAPKEKAAPDEVNHKRDGLAAWVEAQRLRVKMGKKPEKMYLHGKFALVPAAKSDAASRRDLANGTELWVLGVAKDKALVADGDPGSAQLSAMFEKAIGWVKLDRLQKENTAEWLPPDDQLKGEQVWGPLRSGETLLELGTVTDVLGKDISVKRLADGQVSKQPRAKLRPGKIAVGLQLVGVCKDAAKVVKIMEIVPPGRSVRFHCEGTEGIKEDVLEDLRTKLDLLPASK
jgi:hypothetical protein